jgi:hypothetical protein
MGAGQFVSFSDPDGNGWLLQEVTKRLPGRAAGDTTYTKAHDLAQAMVRAATAHGKHEEQTGKADPNWPDWYAEYIVREQSGEEQPQWTIVRAECASFAAGQADAWEKHWP